MSETDTPFCEAAAEWDHDWIGDPVLTCSECGIRAGGQAPSPTKPPALVRTVEYVTVETDPARVVPTNDDSGLDIVMLNPEWNALPDRYLDVLVELVDRSPDDPAHCARCGDPVGYVDELRESTYGAEYEVTVWRCVVLVAHSDGPVSVQCADCGPDPTTWIPESR